jgi:hypothetical protein
MARQTKKALACLLIVPAFLVVTVSVPYADTLVLAAANTWPTAYLVDGRPTGMLVDLVTTAWTRAMHPELRKHSKARTPTAKISKHHLSGCSFCVKARAGDGIPRRSFFSRPKTPLRAIVAGAVLALVNITQATKHSCAPVTVRGEMRRLGLLKPIEHDCLLWKLGWVVTPSPGKLLEKHSETTARGACPVALLSKHTFTSAFGKVCYPRVRSMHTSVRCE